jgi:multidrug efflux pump subunit AcrA (membrane-fusion protein)
LLTIDLLSMKRMLLPVFAVAALVFTAVAVIRMQPEQVKTDPPSPPPVAAYERTIAAVGLTEPSTESVAIGTALAGIVEKVHVTVGQSVEAGAPLFQLDVRHLAADLAVRKAALATARARAATAKTLAADAQDQLLRAERLGNERVISADELMRRKFAVEAAENRRAESDADLAAAEAQVHEAETEIERSVIRAPLEAEVLQVKVRAGEFAPAGQTSVPLLTLGRIRPLHLRVDVDEHEGWRVRPEAGATAHIRGRADRSLALRFVRFEPFVIPKRSLTGESTERVDTRVLQVIYEITDVENAPFVGQQMDVFIEDLATASPPVRTARR